MKRAMWIYGAALALGAAALQWLDYRHAIRGLSTETYVVILGVAFTGLGVWVGSRLFRRGSPPAEFRPNSEAMAYLKVSEREYEVLQELAAGHSNKEIAARLHVSPHTVKTHLSNLYSKLDATRRTQAVQKARELGLIE